MSHPSVDTPSPGTCIRTQVRGGHPRSPLPDEPPDTCPEPRLTPHQACALEGPRWAACAEVALGASRAFDAAAPVRAEALPEGRDLPWRCCGRVTKARSRPCTRWRCTRRRRHAVCGSGGGVRRSVRDTPRSERHRGWNSRTDSSTHSWPSCLSDRRCGPSICIGRRATRTGVVGVFAPSSAPLGRRIT